MTGCLCVKVDQRPQQIYLQDNFFFFLRGGGGLFEIQNELQLREIFKLLFTVEYQQVSGALELFSEKHPINLG